MHRHHTTYNKFLHYIFKCTLLIWYVVLRDLHLDSRHSIQIENLAKYVHERVEKQRNMQRLKVRGKMRVRGKWSEEDEKTHKTFINISCDNTLHFHRKFFQEIFMDLNSNEWQLEHLGLCATTVTKCENAHLSRY